MASHRRRSRSPAASGRSRETDWRASRRRERSVLEHRPRPHRRRRSHSLERGASPARASRREEGPGRTEAQPRHPERHHRSPPHHSHAHSRRRSRPNSTRSSSSRSAAVSPRPGSPHRARQPSQTRSSSAVRSTYLRPSRRRQSRPSSRGTDRSCSRGPSRHATEHRGRRARHSEHSSTPSRRREDFEHSPRHRYREYSPHRLGSSRDSSDSRVPSRSHYRPPSDQPDHRYRRRTSRESTYTRHTPPPPKSRPYNREDKPERSSLGRRHRSTEDSPVRAAKRVSYSRRRDPSDHTKDSVRGKPTQRTALSKDRLSGRHIGPRLGRHGRSSSPNVTSVGAHPAFKVKDKSTKDRSVRSSSERTPPIDSADPSNSDAVPDADVDEMYNAQWQSGRGGSGQRHPSFGYTQNNRGGWQGYQGSPPHNYSPQQQSQYQQFPNAAPQGGYNQQQYGGSPPTNYQHSSPMGARGGAASMTRGQTSFGARGGFRGAHQQSAPVTRGGHVGGNSTRGTAHFSNLSWTPQTGSRGGHAPINKTNSIPAPSLASARDRHGDSTAGESNVDDDDDDDNPFRPSKDLRVEDQSAKKEKEKLKALEEAQQAKNADTEADMPPPNKPASATVTESAGPKFSFSLKSSRPEMSATAAPKPDLLQKTPQTGPSPPTASHVPHRERRFDQTSPPRSREYRDGSRPGPRPRRDQWDDRSDDDRSGASDFRPTGFSLEYKRDQNAAKHMDNAEKDESPRLPASAQRDARAGDKRLAASDVEMRDAPGPPPEVKKKYRKVMVKKLKEKPVVPEVWRKSASIYYRDETQDIVGSGTYGKVYKAVNVYTREVVALKRIRMEGEKDGYPTTAVREIRILQAGSKSSNIVSFLEIMIENNECYMVFEYVEHDLTGLLNNPEFTLSLAHKKDLCRQLFSGIHFCHQNSILHRDIKAANILVTSTGVLKIADFGLARIYDKKAVRDEDPKKRPPYTNRVVTIWYRSPELCLGEVYYSTSVDVWSCACVMMEVYTKGAIFPGDGTEMNQYHKIASILGKPTPEIWPALRDMDWYTVFWPAKNTTRIFEEKFADKMSTSCLDLLSSIFQWDPDRRPSAAEVLDHPFFTDEEPAPQQAVELAELKGDWHEYESKKLRKEKELKDREERHRARAEEATRQQQQQQQLEQEQQQQATQEAEDAGKRKAGSPVDVDVEVKKAREEEVV